MIYVSNWSTIDIYDISDNQNPFLVLKLDIGALDPEIAVGFEAVNI